MSDRRIWLKVRVTDRERKTIKRKAAKLGMTVSEYVRVALIYSDKPNITMIDTTPLKKVEAELRKQGVNLNQLMHFLNATGIEGYNAGEVRRVLGLTGEISLKVMNALGDLRDEADKHHVSIRTESLEEYPSCDEDDEG